MSDSTDPTPEQRPRLKFQLLREDCPRGQFDCGNASIDRWFKQKSKKRHAKYRARVTTAHLPGNHVPAAFYALALHSGSVEDLDETEKNSGWESPGFPCVHLIYFAVVRPMQRQGIGTIALMHALEAVYRISRVAGTYAVTLDAIDENAVKFYERIGFRKYGPAKAAPSMLLPIFSIVDLFETPRH